MNKEIAMKKFMAFKRNKQACVERMSQELIAIYESEYGERPESISVL